MHIMCNGSEQFQVGAPLCGSGASIVISNIAIGPQGSHPLQLPAAAGTDLRFIFTN